MNATITRRELKTYIDAIPEYSFGLVQNFLSYLANTPDDESLVIETDLTEHEKAVIAAGRREWQEHPENFTSWADVKAELRAAGKLA